jgi:hypothetical protein
MEAHLRVPIGLRHEELRNIAHGDNFAPAVYRHPACSPPFGSRRS